MVKSYQLVASIVRSRGVRGEVEVQSIDDLLLHLRPNAQLWVVPPSLEAERQTRIISERGSRELPWLFLEGINDRNSASVLIGRYLLAADEDLLIDDNVLDQNTQQTEQQQDNSQLGLPVPALGRTVSDDQHGLIGTIIEVSEVTPQTLWVVEGPYGQVLIPAVADFVVSWDADNILVELPAGLVELNQ
jgi:16S rRNA processing protein RimM